MLPLDPVHIKGQTVLLSDLPGLRKWASRDVRGQTSRQGQWQHWGAQNAVHTPRTIGTTGRQYIQVVRNLAPGKALETGAKED